MKIVDKINSDKNAATLFLTSVLALGVVGVILCLAWFACLVAKGMEWYWIVFDVAIIAFCVWAVVKGVIPMSKEAYKQIDKMESKK